MSATVKRLAKKYYPKLWDLDAVKALVASSKLTEAEFKEVTGMDYEPDAPASEPEPKPKSE